VNKDFLQISPLTNQSHTKKRRCDIKVRGFKLRALVPKPQTKLHLGNKLELGMGIEPLAAWRYHPQLPIFSLLKNWNEYETP
jgi:hypothetical protein